MTLKCIIVDDEPNAVNLLEVLIGQTTQWQIVGKCYNGIEAIAMLKTQPADLVFLDINMPHLSGMELAALLPPATRIVFTTAYAEHAADSYVYHTIDYLLKPITLKRFLASVQKIEAAFATSTTAGNTAVQSPEPSSPDHYFVKSGKTLKRIALSDVLYFEGDKEYVRLVTIDEELLVYRRLKEVAAQLPSGFVRVHNSYIVNASHIIKVQDNHIYIGNKQIPVSDKFRENFMELIRKQIF